MPGTVIDSRYELLRLIGSGGMGTVYEALHLGTGKRVAVKLISRADVADDDEILVRFQREAKAAGSIDTPHIVTIFDAGRDHGTAVPFIAMELLDGYDVKQLVGRFGALSPDLALSIAAQACNGLAKAHEARIVHRDIKPANIFLARSSDGSVIVKLLDFGIAKLPPDLLASIEGGQVTITGKLIGSPLFMSPEQAKGLKTLDHRTDIWSLGAVLYEALAGHAPFSSLSTVGQLIVAICSQEPERLEVAAPWIPEGAAVIVRRAMSIDVEQRYATVAEMLEDLLELLPGGAAIDESALAGMSQLDSPCAPPSVKEATTSTVLSGSPTPKRHDVQLAFVEAMANGRVNLSLPPKPVTVSVAPRQSSWVTLRSSENPVAVADGDRPSPTTGSRVRSVRIWGPIATALTVVVIALAGWGGRARLRAGSRGDAPAAKSSMALGVANITESLMPSLLVDPLPPPDPTRDVNTEAVASDSKVASPALSRAEAKKARPTESGLLPAKGSSPTGKSSPISPEASAPSANTALSTSSPANGIAAESPRAADSRSEAPPSPRNPDAGAPHRSHFDRLNPNFD
jgi:serine/threonine protein kinase